MGTFSPAVISQDDGASDAHSHPVTVPVDPVSSYHRLDGASVHFSCPSLHPIKFGAVVALQVSRRLPLPFTRPLHVFPAAGRPS